MEAGSDQEDASVTWRSRERSLAPAALAAVLALAGCMTAPEAALGPRDRDEVRAVEAYLNGVRTLHARFVEIGAQGREDGEVWLERPDHLRLDYVSPRPRTVVASRGRLVATDPATGGTTSLPVSRTPLGILLRDRIELSGPVEVTALQRQPGLLALTLVERESPGRGALTLRLREDPLALVGVTTTDRTGATEDLTLSDVSQPPRVDPALFEQQRVFAPAS